MSLNLLLFSLPTLMYRRPKSLGTVVESVNSFDGTLCVDVFERPDGSFGFEEYRRDVEDGCGWFPIGFHSGKTYPDFEAAHRAAEQCVAWFEDEA